MSGSVLAAPYVASLPTKRKWVCYLRLLVKLTTGFYGVPIASAYDMNNKICIDFNCAQNWLTVVGNGLLLLLFVGLSSSGWAQLQTADNFSTRAAVTKRLEAARAEFSATEMPADSVHQEARKQLEAALYQHLEAIENLQQMDRENREMRDALRDWSGFEQPPPYSILFGHELRFQRQSLSRQHRAAVLRRTIISQAIDDEIQQLLSLQAAQRQYRETAELTSDVDDRRRSLQAAELATLNIRVLAESVARLKLRRASHDLQLEAIASALELNRLKIDTVGGHEQDRDPNADRHRRSRFRSLGRAH